MEEPIITRNPLKSLLQKMLRKQPCLKLPFTTPRAQARRDSFKVGLGTKNRIFPVHKYQSHHSVYGRNKSRDMYLGKTITTHTYLGAKSLSYEGVFQRKKKQANCIIFLQKLVGTNPSRSCMFRWACQLDRERYIATCGVIWHQEIECVTQS